MLLVDELTKQATTYWSPVLFEGVTFVAMEVLSAVSVPITRFLLKLSVRP
jgi:hypothetical protein